MTMGRAALTAVCLTILAAGCRSASDPLSEAEAAYLETRTWADQIDVTRARGADRSLHGLATDSLLALYRAARAQLLPMLAGLDTLRLDSTSRRAVRTMRETVATALGVHPAPVLEGGGDSPPNCSYDPDTVAAAPGGADSLAARIIACYGAAQRAILHEGRTLDRLTILGLLGTTESREARQRLFYALQPVWRSVNGDGAPTSPYRRLVRARLAAWGTEPFPAAKRAEALGVTADTAEAWLVRLLEAWRDANPDALIDPWDFWYRNGEAERLLDPHVPHDALTAINDAFYTALGARPDVLNIQYDLEPRAGKYPVAYSTFGARNGAPGGPWTTGEPTIFATYRTGGLGNLFELLHETGHGIHIAGIRTRPAFTEWPDSDTFTEAIADVASLELFEPAWQRRYLNAEAPLAASLRAKYASLVLDAAWALFEFRVHRNPAADPNAIWTEITSTYLRIRPHPELSWWAMRGQLVDSPGYMINYALGGVLIAQIRDRIRELRGRPVGEDGAEWYPWMVERLYRFGLERPTREVVREFLGGPLSLDAPLADLSRSR